MRKLVSLVIASSAVVALASGCAVEPMSEDVGAVDEAACSNLQGTNAMIAAVAVAIANELGRWNVSRDFQLGKGSYNQDVMQLSYTGNQRCAARNNPCTNVKALLAVQDAKYDLKIKFPDGTALSSWSYASRLVSGWRAQKTCEDRALSNPGSSNPNACAAEEHLLTPAAENFITPGVCDVNYTFDARTPAGALLKYPAHLKNKLLWANDGGSVTNPNPYIAFQSTASTVTIDPTWDLNPPGTQSGGSCTICKTQKYSSTDLTGQCCKTSDTAPEQVFGAISPNIYKCM
jgi:hypothetical protein